MRIVQSNASGCIRSVVQPVQVNFTLQLKVGVGHRSFWFIAIYRNFREVWGRGGRIDRPSFIGFYQPTDSQGHQSRRPCHSGFQSDIHMVEFLHVNVWYKSCAAYGKKEK